MRDHRPLVIAGSGGFGREVALVATAPGSPWDFRGFVDDARVGSTPEGWPILGTIETVPPGCPVCVAVGNPRVRRGLVTRLACLGAIFADRVDLGSRHASVSIGPGAMLAGGARTTVQSRFGSHLILNINVSVGHDVEAGDFVTVAPLAAISGNVRIGSGVEIGTGAAIREGIRIGEGAMVGMGAVVVKDIPPNTLVVGNPARPIRDLEPWT